MNGSAVPVRTSSDRAAFVSLEHAAGYFRSASGLNFARGRLSDSATCIEGASEAGLAVRRFDHFGNWYEDVRGQTCASYLAARPGQSRETIRRKLRREHAFELIEAGSALEPGVAAFESVYARSWLEMKDQAVPCGGASDLDRRTQQIRTGQGMGERTAVQLACGAAQSPRRADRLRRAGALACPVQAGPRGLRSATHHRARGSQQGAEQLAAKVLSQTQQLREYSQRFAFVINDIKNVSGQLSMPLTNAEVHADNPEFQRDMLATVRAPSARSPAC